MHSSQTPTADAVSIEVLSRDTPVNMANQWYEYATAEHFWMQWRFQVLKNLLAKQSLGDKIIEIGCGNCIARDQFEDYLNLPIDGCDLNRSSVEMAGPARGKLYLYDIFDARPEWKEHFSTILLLDTLEHIDQPAEFLKAIGYHSQPNGLLVINVPALQSLYSAYDEIAGHVKRYTKSLLAKELEAGGYELVDAQYWGLSMIPVLSLRKALGAIWSRERVIANGFQPSSKVIDGTLRALMKAECALLRRPPLGTSLSAVARKRS